MGSTRLKFSPSSSHQRKTRSKGATASASSIYSGSPSRPLLSALKDISWILVPKDSLKWQLTIFMRFPHPGCQVSTPRELPAPAAKTASKRFFNGAGGPTSVELRCWAQVQTSKFATSNTSIDLISTSLSRQNNQCPRLQTFQAPDTEVASYLSTYHWVVSECFHSSEVGHGETLHCTGILLMSVSNSKYAEMTSQKHQVKGPDDGWVNMTTLPFLELILHNCWTYVLKLSKSKQKLVPNWPPTWNFVGQHLGRARSSSPRSWHIPSAQVAGGNITKWKQSLEAHNWFKGIGSAAYAVEVNTYQTSKTFTSNHDTISSRYHPLHPQLPLWPDLITTTLIIDQIVHLQLAVGFKIFQSTWNV